MAPFRSRQNGSTCLERASRAPINYYVSFRGQSKKKSTVPVWSAYGQPINFNAGGQINSREHALGLSLIKFWVKGEIRPKPNVVIRFKRVRNKMLALYSMSGSGGLGPRVLDRLE